jgi:Holliday junction DNA helicase RuvA
VAALITGLRGIVGRVQEDEIRLLVGPIEYQILVPDLVRRTLHMQLGEEVSLRTIEYLEGNPTRGRQTPRLIGFLSEPQIEFFELFCTVDGIGVRTALKAMVRSVRDIADMIQRQDVQSLSTLPGISKATGERIVAKLRKKVTKFALMPVGEQAPIEQDHDPDAVQEAFLALLSVGHSETEARKMLESVLGEKKKYSSSQDMLLAVYGRQS